MGGAMLVSGAGAASATTTDTRLAIRDISPNPVVVKAGSETTAYFDVGASSDVQKVELSVAPASGFHTMRTKSVKDLEGWRFAIGFNQNDPAGKWKATAVAFDSAGKQIARDSAFFSLAIVKGKADTRITGFNASPSTVRKGKSIYFSGTLIEKERRGWDGVRNAKVNIYYRANGSSGWKWVDSDRTSGSGKFYAETRAYKSGTFKAVYSGSSKLDDATSRTDYVRVYGSTWRR
ncbi:hypothetical protein ITP53_45940 [Nonomuraea sp. K274]|uniref:Uncharacterized protein n=1 Tax=Nonomuraea cypriaca TaxID=1187855 RepID=A0A931AHE0_9ACTN|nr:hypothetical protein [Nonomuraea cypriaca]MBF8192901.1 hypothetical protein [Nonomuraea cypriaca]